MTGWSQKCERLTGGNTWERSRGEQVAWGRESLTDLLTLLLPLPLVSQKFIKTKKCYRTYLLCCLPGALWLQVLDSSFYPHCEFTFMDGIRWSNFLFCMRLSSFPNTPHWRTSCLFPIIYSGSFALICHVYMSTSGLFILSSWSTCLFLFQYILFQWLYLCNMLDIRKQDAFHFVVLPQDYFDSQGLLWFHSIWSHWLCRFRVLWTL